MQWGWNVVLTGFSCLVTFPAGSFQIENEVLHVQPQLRNGFLDEPQDVPLTGVSGFLPEPEEGTFTRIGLNDFYDLLMEQQEQM